MPAVNTSTDTFGRVVDYLPLRFIEPVPMNRADALMDASFLPVTELMDHYTPCHPMMALGG